ncbi:MAG: S8 family serine peptidase [Pseudomonadota bacterium]
MSENRSTPQPTAPEIASELLASLQMPRPQDAAPAARPQPAQGMPVPSMTAPREADPMPRPAAAMGAAAAGARRSARRVMDGALPVLRAQIASASQMPPPADAPRARSGAAIPRFPSDANAAGPRYQPGLVEVEFRDGLLPSVTHGETDLWPSVRAGAAALDALNEVLQRYQLISAEPSFGGMPAEWGAAQATAAGQGVQLPHLGNFVTLHFPSDANVGEIAELLRQLPEVERAVPLPTVRPPSELLAEDMPAAALPASVPLGEPLVGLDDQAIVDPLTGRENQWYLFRCRADKAWIRATGANVVVADVDWGYRTSHQDLAPHMGRTYNAVDGSANVTTGGSVFHGTGVLGLAGAAVNALGLAGVGFDVEMWGVQADSGPGPALGGNPWARGIDWVRTTDSGGKRKVVILEVQTGAFGNIEQVPSVNAAIRTAIAAGVVVCVAAGNGDRDAGIDDSGNPIPPTGSILVGATAFHTSTNPRAWFSNYGAEVVVAAPGDPDHDVTCDSGADNAYSNYFGGTSGATPKVAGTVALMLASNPGLSHAQIRAMLIATGGAVATEAGKPVGRFLNAEGAVRAAAVGAVGRMEVFARGTDKAVWHLWQTAPNNGWSGWAPLGGWVDLIRTARNADGRLELFARGADQAVWHMWQTAPNNGWSGWHSLGGWVDLLEVGQNQDGRLELFARGADGALWHKWQSAPNNGWSDWATLGGWVDRLAVGRNQDGRLEVFARGGDGALWHNWQTAPNNGWSGWASLGGWIDRLEVGRNADGRLEVFARGGDGALWHNWQSSPNNGWSGWSSMGGWVDLLAIGNNEDGRLEVFARGSDRAVWHKWQEAPNGGWSGWNSMGGWVDRLALSQNADGRLELFARGADQALWHRWQSAPNNGWSGWASLGGVIDSIEVAQNAP